LLVFKLSADNFRVKPIVCPNLPEACFVNQSIKESD
jgi:hypothetical protein